MGVDVLIVAALPMEFAAAKRAGEAGGVTWQERDACLVGTYGRKTLALARPLHMGGRTAGPFAATLVDRLRPACVAMPGVCAGSPADTVLGDVVVADPVYEWDEGKWSTDGFAADHRQYRLDPALVRAAQDLDSKTLPSWGPGDARAWLLERLHFGQSPREHPARGRYFPSGTWTPRLAEYEAAGLITRDAAGEVALTDAGAAQTRRRLYDDVDGPQTLPFQVHVAPMASGSAVVADPSIWPGLRERGMRKIAAVEMEAATIATVAHDANLPWLAVKGVMDHAGADKEDRYKEFAAKASAEVLFALLEHVPAGKRAKGFTIHHAQGVVIGDNNFQTNTFS